jgi:hypothetical protein
MFGNAKTAPNGMSGDPQDFGEILDSPTTTTFKLISHREE